MKNLNDLLQQFDDIQELPVSEEILGAYIEGKLVGSELDEVTQQVSSDIHLRELLHDATEPNMNEQADASNPWDPYEGDYGYWELGLPPLLSPDDLSPDEDKENIENFSAYSDSSQDEETLSLQNSENNLSFNPSKLNDMANNSRTIIYGEASENIYDPVYVQQPDDHSCALRCQQIVLRDFGINIPFKDLERIALDKGVYTNSGTYTYDIGKVLHLAGVGMHQTVGNSVDDLINELVQGHRVIVSVDAHELWFNNTMEEKMKNWINDAIRPQGGNHALIVAGVEIDPNNPDNSKVVLTDPGDGHLRIEYPLEQFKGAWGDSNCFMAATNDPAPYQYDAKTGMEVPSNFVVKQYINDFVARNSYQLSPDMINVPQDYQPAFTGHLNVVGDIDYDTFKDNYDAMVASRMPSTLSIKEQIEELVKQSERQVNPSDNNLSSFTKATPNDNNNKVQSDKDKLNQESSSSKSENDDDDKDEKDDEPSDDPENKDDHEHDEQDEHDEHEYEDENEE